MSLFDFPARSGGEGGQVVWTELGLAGLVLVRRGGWNAVTSGRRSTCVTSQIQAKERHMLYREIYKSEVAVFLTSRIGATTAGVAPEKWVLYEEFTWLMHRLCNNSTKSKVYGGRALIYFLYGLNTALLDMKPELA